MQQPAYLRPAIFVASPAGVAVELLIIMDERLHKVLLASKPVELRVTEQTERIQYLSTKAPSDVAVDVWCYRTM